MLKLKARVVSIESASMYAVSKDPQKRMRRYTLEFEQADGMFNRIKIPESCFRGLVPDLDIVIELTDNF